MPTIEELWMQIEVLGIGELVKASDAMDKSAASTDRLRDAQAKLNSGAAGGKTTKQQAQDIYDFADAYEVLGEKMESVFTSAQQVGLAQKAIANTVIPNGTDAQLIKTAEGLDKVEKASGRAKGGVAGFGQTALQSGRIVQDFAQGGIGGILNNIEGLTMALGLGSGLAGVLTILGVGFMVLKPQIMAFWDALNAGAGKEAVSNFDRLSARIKELKDQPLKMAVDRRELDQAEAQLDRLKKGQAEFEAMQKKQTPEQAESGKLVDETIASAGAPQVAERLRKALQVQMEAQDGPLAEIRKKIAQEDANAEQAKKDMQSGGLEDTMAAEAQLKIAEGNRARLVNEANNRKLAIEANAKNEAGSIIDVAKTGNAGGDRNQAAAQKKLVDYLEKAGMGGLARDLKTVTPDAIKKADAEVEAAEDFGDRATRAGEARRQEAARQKKEADAEKKREAAAKQTPEYKEFIAQRKRRGEMDAFGRQIGEEGFNERSAAEVARKANLDIKKAKPSREKPGRMATPAQLQHVADARRREALASQIHQGSGGGFTPDQSRQIAGRAMHLAQKNGDLSGSIMTAMAETQAAMAGMMGRITMLEQKAMGLHANANQLNRRAHQHQPSALNSGGFP